MSDDNRKKGVEGLNFRDRPDVSLLYPDVCFASLDAVGDMSVPLFAESLLHGWTPEPDLTSPSPRQTSAPFPVASLVVSRDSTAQFHPEMSNREPLEIQVWADGEVSLEIEFQGIDVATVPPSWADTADRVLRSWSATYGLTLRAVFNDRARSLPDVWNATFWIPKPEEHTVKDLVSLGERALATAELSMTGWGGEEDVRRLLANRDTHAILGWQPSAVLEFWAAPPDSGDAHLLAADVCALANQVRGGTVVIGVAETPSGREFRGFVADDQIERIESLILETLFPVPEQLLVRHLPLRGDDGGDGDGQGVVIVQVPAQDELLRPFMLHQLSEVGSGNLGRGITLVEREGAESLVRSAAAIHSALACGMALLRREEKP